MRDTLVRPETASDIDAVRNVNVEAFREHPISRQTEHLIVDALRTAGALDVSLVADAEGRILGHIALSKAGVGDSDSGWYLLGPVAVLPDSQAQGIGSALVETGLAELRARGAAGCVLVGDPDFYGRFGFTTFPGLAHEGVPDQYVLALAFSDDKPSGHIRAHEAFAVEPEPDAGRV
ncbi:MAG: N-acetyltransferase [Coriobacteriia bacterium]|nr:N-acetyltransferase [Coriobacteriia bacterium]